MNRDYIFDAPANLQEFGIREFTSAVRLADVLGTGLSGLGSEVASLVVKYLPVVSSPTVINFFGSIGCCG